MRPSTKVGNASTLRLDGREHLGLYDGEKATEPGYPFRDTCGKCGARRIDRQIGLEATPEAYLATMVQVFREVRRVLRPDGTCWVNVGDSYAGSHETGRRDAQQGRRVSSKAKEIVQRSVNFGAKPKDLLLMPARLALALQADGWWVRSDIIWHKPNPMPESCTDRPTSAHEHVFLLTKSARYFYDAEAVREEGEGYGRSNWNAMQYKCGDVTRNHGGKGEHGRGGGVASMEGGRNLRNVWTLATHAFPEAHFATYPPELVERCIKAGTSERGCCAACGKPWQRITDRGDLVPTRKNHDLRPCGVVVDAPDANDAGRNRARDGHRANMAYETTTTGWSAGCKCHGHFEERPGPDDWISDETGERKTVRVWVPDGDVPPPVPCTVLDPFLGSGTTALVADRLQRHAIGIDLSLTYAAMAQRRIEMDCPLFTSWAPAEDPEDERQKELFLEPEYGA